MTEERHIKLNFLHDAFGDETIESAWGVKEGSHYRLDNVLFYAKEYSLNDVIEATLQNGKLFVNKLIRESGHSTIRVLLADSNKVSELRNYFLKKGCASELSNMDNMIAVDIPPTVDWIEIKTYLDKGEGSQKWQYQEACISSTHSTTTGK